MNLREKLLEIGDDLAMIRGGHCHDYTMNRKEKIVTFNCKNNNEEFVIEMNFREIESIWGIPGKELYWHETERK